MRKILIIIVALISVRAYADVPSSIEMNRAWDEVKAKYGPCYTTPDNPAGENGSKTLRINGKSYLCYDNGDSFDCTPH